MRVYAVGVNLKSRPGRYHRYRDCWAFLAIAPQTKRSRVKTFEADRDDLVSVGFWPCSYCAVDQPECCQQGHPSGAQLRPPNPSVTVER